MEIPSMTRMVNCIKLKREAEGLDRPMYPGPLGQRIFENVSKEAYLTGKNFTWQNRAKQIKEFINDLFPSS